MPFARFRTPETLALLAAMLVVSIAVPLALGFSAGWIAAICAGTHLFVSLPLAVKVQDWLLERSLATGRFDRALRIASAVRDGTRGKVAKQLAEFDVGLVHLARGAPADALRAFGRVEKNRLKESTRVLVDLYASLARLRNGEPVAAELARVADLALAAFPEDAEILSAKAEALLAQGDAAGARALLVQSLELNPDPHDPSPGERHVLFARTAAATGAPDEARKALKLVVNLPADGPFVRAARAELESLGSHESVRPT